MTTHPISSALLDEHHVMQILHSKTKLSLSFEAREAIVNGRAYLDNKLATNKGPIYGINTGFGSLCNVIISDNDLNQLQENLVLSHACGTGDEVPIDIVRLMLFLKIQGLSYGNSGVCIETVERLIDLYNCDIIPVVYQQGSLGASGDLAPLAHISLALLGRGEVIYKGERMAAQTALSAEGLSPIVLQAKEGLALLNGTQFMNAYAVYLLDLAQKLASKADMLAALSLEGFDGRPEPFDALVHNIRNHQGQKTVAANILDWVEGSELIIRPKAHVQDPYSFRCVPQVHGATRDAIAYVQQVVRNEMNAVTDNPTLFPEDDKIISGGNFHGQPLALALDFLCIALAELGSISERRTYKLISGQRELPAFLVANPGLNSGLMISHYTAASIVSQNKQLCMPASVDTIDSSNGQEDHVSMGANAATKCYRVVQNVQQIFGIELLTAAQALDFRRPAKTSVKLEKLIADYRKQVSFIAQDRLLHDDMIASKIFLNNYN